METANDYGLNSKGWGGGFLSWLFNERKMFDMVPCVICKNVVVFFRVAFRSLPFTDFSTCGTLILCALIGGIFSILGFKTLVKEALALGIEEYLQF